MLEGVEDGGPVTVGEVELASSAWSDVVGDDSGDLGTEGLARDWLLTLDLLQ